MTMLDDDFNGSKFRKAVVADAKKEKQVEQEMFESFLFKVWSKAQSLEFSDFKGWCKGEGYVVSRMENLK